jgi:two-component system, OmpR family, alkaline phosphatase synthesis response regulator PhoP
METLRNQNKHQPYRDEHLFVDLRQELVTLDSQILNLTSKEYCLLVLLVQHAGEAIPRDTLAMQVWGHALSSRSRTVDSYIRELRRKLGIYGKQYIETVAGMGYRFRPRLRLFSVRPQSRI